MKPAWQRAKALTLAVLGPFLGRNMPVFAGCATLFLLTCVVLGVMRASKGEQMPLPLLGYLLPESRD